MSTVSVPLPEDKLRALKALVRQGVAPNMAEIIRRAVTVYLEDQAVAAVLKAAKEPSLDGDLDELAKKL